MRDLIRIVEQADADDMYGDAQAKAHTFARRGGQEFGDKGRADIPARRNNPRFADNSMAAGDDTGEHTLNEFAGETEQLDQLHQWLLQHVSDDEIIQGIQLANSGKQKIAAKFGRSPEDVEALLNTLRQDLTTAKERDTDNDLLLGDYDIPEGLDHPFDRGTTLEADHRFSAEPDYMGNVTIRDAETGKERYIQGSRAAAIRSSLDRGADPDQVLAPLMEDADHHPHQSDFMAEIKARTGMYNFPWKYPGDTEPGAESRQHGFATAEFHSAVDNQRPQLTIVSVTDADGNEVATDEAMHADLLDQAMKFIGHE